MSIDVKKYKKDLDEWFESDAGKAYFENIHKKNEIQQGRYARFEKWLETHDINELMQRLVKEHGEERHDYCYKKGFEPYPNNKLAFLIDYVVHNYAPVNVPQLDNFHSFPNQVWFFKGYYIQMTWGQGVFIELYDSKLNQIIAL
jgi:hypothetical protein